MFTKKAARLADKLRFVSIFVLIALLVIGFLLKDKAGIEYFLYPVYDDKEVIDSVFEEENPFVVMYPNSSEDKVNATAAAIAADKDVKSVTTYAGTLGITLGVDEAVEMISTQFPDLIGSVPPSMSSQISAIMQDLFKAYLGKEDLDGTERVEMYGFVSYVLGDMLTDDSVNNIVKTLILSDPETKAQCESVKAMLKTGRHSEREHGRVLHNGQQLSRLRNARVLFRRSKPDHADLGHFDIHSSRVNFQIADNPHGAGGSDTMRGLSDAELFVPGAPGILLSRRDYRSGDTDGRDDRLRHTVHQQLP